MKQWKASVAVLLVISCLLVACTSSKQNAKEKNGGTEQIATIQHVLTNQFTSDPELIKHIESGDSATVIDSNGNSTQPTSPSPLETYYKKMYGAYFTKKAFEVFVAANAFRYISTAQNRGYTLAVTDVKATEVKGSKGDYDFTINFVAKKEGESGKSFTVTGRTSVNADGKITYIRYDDADFMKAMQ
ncbi:hypothetical protein [Bacillus sp. AFS017336]|uniref:hypothetical protein n=1 Tax=Bacillus sp. AFS017336 TaxID=2033489 RepID=UPI000BF102C0|nr:hypothetical protein [Bacillus sp. AFS017336]PEL07689.1 hypothetical protein CN601_19800 [Bacillus sp. AFS017336]